MQMGLLICCRTLTDTTGNAATATALETARTIGGVSFDGMRILTHVNTAGDQDTSGNVQQLLATARTIMEFLLMELQT